MENFVSKHSVVRRIWGKSDTILLIFAGAAAEFALSKAVDWLYFTGRLPSDPLGRLFSTVSYARTIVFAERASALRAIDAITAIHGQVEKARGARIPDWAYRDVLFMLIDYSIRSYELLERSLSAAEKEEVFDVFYRVGERMGIQELPQSFEAWERMRREHLQQHLAFSPHTEDLFGRYRQHLGAVRYRLLLEAQILLVPERVRTLLGLRHSSPLRHFLLPYKYSRLIQLDRLLKALILPARYHDQINALNSVQP